MLNRLNITKLKKLMEQKRAAGLDAHANSIRVRLERERE